MEWTIKGSYVSQDIMNLNFNSSFLVHSLNQAIAMFLIFNMDLIQQNERVSISFSFFNETVEYVKSWNITSLKNGNFELFNLAEKQNLFNSTFDYFKNNKEINRSFEIK